MYQTMHLFPAFSQYMEHGVNGGTMEVAANLVVEALNTGLGRVMIHLHSMEGTLAPGHHTNQLPAIRSVVRRCTNQI